MKRFAFLAVILFSTYGLSSAQNDKKPEFFAGYSFESVNSGITSSDLQAAGTTQTSLDNRFNLNGFNVSGTAYLTRHLGIAGDFSAHFDRRDDLFDTVATRSKFSLFNLTAGPQYKFSSSGRFTPFTHALFGIARRSLTETFSDGSDYFIDRNTSFAMNLGGGVDYRLNDRVALRLFQFDYNPIFLRSRTFNAITFPDRTLNGVRISAGIVIK
jgi:opacity protein-like surface antigen